VCKAPILHVIKMKTKHFFLFLSLGLLLACRSGQWHYQRSHVLDPIAAEVSGLKIRGDTCWIHNDSGGTPTLYALGKKGQLLDSLLIPGAQNVDWEDLSQDDEGYFYAGDIGNNRNQRRDLTIYRWRKGDAQAGAIRFSYPDQQSFPPPREQWNFDSEAFFWFQDSLFLFSKNRFQVGNYYTKLYAIPARPGTHVAVLKDSLFLEDRVVTGAAIRPDGQEIALITYDFRPQKLQKLKASLILIQGFEGTDFLQAQTLYRKEVPPLQNGRQFEAIDYAGPSTILIATEKTPINRPFVARLHLR
jgi:hypothetical protein